MSSMGSDKAVFQINDVLIKLGESTRKITCSAERIDDKTYKFSIEDKDDIFFLKHSTVSEADYEEKIKKKQNLTADFDEFPRFLMSLIEKSKVPSNKFSLSMTQTEPTAFKITFQENTPFRNIIHLQLIYENASLKLVQEKSLYTLKAHTKQMEDVDVDKSWLVDKLTIATGEVRDVQENCTDESQKISSFEVKGEKQMEDGKEFICELDKAVSKMAHQLQENEILFEAVTEEKIDLEVKIETLIIENKSLKKQLKKQEKTLSKIKTDMEKTDEEKTCFKKRKDDAEKDVLVLREKVSNQTKTLAEKDFEIDELKHEIKFLGDEIKRLHAVQNSEINRQVSNQVKEYESDAAAFQRTAKFFENCTDFLLEQCQQKKNDIEHLQVLYKNTSTKLNASLANEKALTYKYNQAVTKLEVLERFLVAQLAEGRSFSWTEEDENTDISTVLSRLLERRDEDVNNYIEKRFSELQLTDSMSAGREWTRKTNALVDVVATQANVEPLTSPGCSTTK